MKTFIITFFSICISFSLSAQSLQRSVVSNAGGFFTSASMTLEYTVGEAVVGSFNTSTLKLGQGYNQIADTQSVSVGTLNMQHIKMYPNPAISHLTIETDKDLSVSLYDLLGKNVVAGTNIIAGNSSNISTEKLAPGIYLIQLQDEARRTNTVKWIKQ